MEEHEEYPESLMSTEGCDPGAQELPSMRIFEIVEHSHMHGTRSHMTRDSFEDTSIFLLREVDLHVEANPILYLGSMMLHGYT
jgi:hypothetical protein